MKTTILERGQVTVPQHLRRRMGMRCGDVIEWSRDEDGRLVGKKSLDDYLERISRLQGIIDIGMTVDELMEELRGPREAR